MVRTIPFARPAGVADRGFPGDAAAPELFSAPAGCEHRTVSKDGRIVCKKIVEGDPEVSPNVCRACPFKATNCTHLRFSLRLTSPSPLLVRYNGRTELWDDGPAELCFERAACAERVMPISDPRACANCSLRQPLQAPAEEPATRAGRVVAFPGREAVAATG